MQTKRRPTGWPMSWRRTPWPPAAQIDTSARPGGAQPAGARPAAARPAGAGPLGRAPGVAAGPEDDEGPRQIRRGPGGAARPAPPPKTTHKPGPQKQRGRLTVVTALTADDVRERSIA